MLSSTDLAGNPSLALQAWIPEACQYKPEAQAREPLPYRLAWYEPFNKHRDDHPTNRFIFELTAHTSFPAGGHSKA